MSNKILKDGELIPLIYDKMLKKVFGNPDNTEPIKYLIECVLKEKISFVELLPQDIIGDNKYTKKNTVDVIVTLEDKRKVIVEANTSFGERIKKRNDHFLSRVMSLELKTGDLYDDYHDHYLINLNLTGSKKYPIMRYTEKADQIDIEPELYEHQVGRYTYDVNISFFTEKCYNSDRKKLDEQEMFLGMLNCRDQKKVRKFMGVNKMMDDIIDQVQTFSQDEIMALAYNEEEHDKYIKKLRDLDFQDELAQKQAKFDKIINQKQAKFDKIINQKQAKFDKKINQEKDRFEQEMNQEKDRFEQEMAQRAKQFERDMIDKKIKLEEDISRKELLLIEKAKEMGLSKQEIVNVFNS